MLEVEDFFSVTWDVAFVGWKGCPDLFEDKADAGGDVVEGREGEDEEVCGGGAGAGRSWGEVLLGCDEEEPPGLWPEGVRRVLEASACWRVVEGHDEGRGAGHGDERPRAVVLRVPGAELRDN